MHVASHFANTSVKAGLGAKSNLTGARRVAIVPTAWGSCGVAWREIAAGECGAGPCIDALLTRIITPGLNVYALRQALMRVWPGADEVLADSRGRFHPEVVPLWFGELVGFLQAYYASGTRPREEGRLGCAWESWRERLDLSRLTAFQQAVLAIVAKIPRGTRMSYGEVARAAGRPGAARAVGAALRAKPIPVLIPCHRVVGAGGQMTGFSAPGGVEAKRKMLELERSGGE